VLRAGTDGSPWASIPSVPALVAIPAESAAGAAAAPVDPVGAPPRLVPAGPEQLVPLDDLLPRAISRIDALERLVAGQQAQLNGLVSLQHDILSMYRTLCGQQQVTLEDYHALWEGHETLCDCLQSLGLEAAALGGPLRAARRTASSFLAAEAERQPANVLMVVLQEPQLASLAGLAAGDSGLRRLAALSRMHAAAQRGGGGIHHYAASPLRTSSAAFASASLWSSPQLLRTPPLPLAGAGTDDARWCPRPDGCSSASLPVEVYAVGGSVGKPVASAERLFSPTGHWEPCVTMAVARFRHVALVMGGHVYVIGGHDGERCLASSERLNIASGSWEELQPMITARCGHDVAALGGTLIVTGGTSDSCVQTVTHLTDCEQFDPVALPTALPPDGNEEDDEAFQANARLVGEWTTAGRMKTPRSGHTSLVLMGRLYVVGGEVGARSASVACESLAPGSRSWMPLPPLTTKWRNLSAAAAAGKLYVVASPTTLSVVASVCECYDPMKGDWHVLPQNLALSAPATAASAGDRLLVFGGRPSEAGHWAVHQYDPEEQQWEPLPPLPVEGVGEGGDRALRFARAFSVGSELLVLLTSSGADAGSRDAAGGVASCVRWLAEASRWERLAAPLRPDCELAIAGGCPTVVAAIPRTAETIDESNCL